MMKNLTLLVLVGWLCSCNTSQSDGDNSPRYDSVKVYRQIVDQPVFHMWNTDTVQKYIGLNANSIRQRKGDIISLTINDNRNRLDVDHYYDCEAQVANDTLLIAVGVNDLFTASGIKIHVVNRLFTTNYYEGSDVVVIGQKKPQYVIESQKLYLSKADYKVGDSIYGIIYARIRDKDNVKYYFNGFFKSKVEKAGKQ